MTTRDWKPTAEHYAPAQTTSTVDATRLVSNAFVLNDLYHNLQLARVLVHNKEVKVPTQQIRRRRCRSAEQDKRPRPYGTVMVILYNNYILRP